MCELELYEVVFTFYGTIVKTHRSKIKEIKFSTTIARNIKYIFKRCVLSYKKQDINSFLVIDC